MPKPSGKNGSSQQPPAEPLPYTPTYPNRDQRFTSDRKSYDIKRGELTGLQAEICRLYAQGIKPKAIADQLSIDPVTVYNIVGSDLGKHQVAILKRARDIESVEVGKRYLELQPIAQAVLEEVMLGGEKDADRLKAAIYVAGVGGHTPIQRSIQAKGIFSKDEIDEIAGNIDHIKKKEIKPEDVKDADYQEID